MRSLSMLPIEASSLMEVRVTVSSGSKLSNGGHSHCHVKQLVRVESQREEDEAIEAEK